MRVMRIITMSCWLITAIALVGLAIWFLTGTVFGYRSDKWNSRGLGVEWFSGINFGGWERLSGPFETVGTFNYSIININSLNIKWVAGDITVTPHNGNDIQITEFAQRKLSDSEKMHISESGGTLTIKFRESIGSFRMPQKRLEVLVPRELCGSLDGLTVDSVSGAVFLDNIGSDSIKTNTTSGRVSISNSTARVLDVSSASGSLTLESAQADEIDLNSISGGIRISDSSAKKIDCDTASGSINISGAFGRAKLNSVSGRITLSNSEAHSTLVANNTSGSLDISGSFDSVKADSTSGRTSIRSLIVPGSLKVGTVSGSIAITVPNEGSISVNHSSVSGRFSSDIPVVMQNRNAQFELSSISGSARILELD